MQFFLTDLALGLAAISGYLTYELSRHLLADSEITQRLKKLVNR